MAKRAAIVAAIFVAGASCAPVPESEPSIAPAAAMSERVRSAATVTGQPVRTVDAPWEAVISVSELPPGGVLPMHRHPWPRYFYVERGRIRVSYQESGMVREFGPGEAAIEAIDQWHVGEAVGPDPVRLVVFDQVPRGETNVIRR